MRSEGRGQELEPTRRRFFGQQAVAWHAKVPQNRFTPSATVITAVVGAKGRAQTKTLVAEHAVNGGKTGSAGQAIIRVPTAAC